MKETESKLDINNQSFNKTQRKEIEALVARLNLDRGAVERGDFIASLRADAEKVQSRRQFKADKVVARGGEQRNVRNDFANNSITQFHMQAIEDIADTIKSSTRHELKNNVARIEQLSKFLETSDVQDKKFLQDKYAGALKFVEAEHQKKSKLSTIVGKNLLDLTTQYLDVKTLSHGLFDNNPAMMAAFSLTSKAIKKVRENKELKDKTLTADAEATIVNTRTETINERRNRKDVGREGELTRIRQETGNIDNEGLLGSYDGTNDPAPTKISQPDTQTRSGIQATPNTSFANTVNDPTTSPEVELTSLIQKDVQLIRQFLIKDSKGDRSEELQMKAKAKASSDKNKGAKDGTKKDDDGDDDDSIFDTIGDFFGRDKKRKRKGRKNRRGRKGRKGKFGRLGKGLGGLLKRGAGLAKAGVGLAVGGSLLGGLMGGADDAIPAKKLPDIASTVVKEGSTKGAGKSAGKGIAKAGGKGIGKGLGKGIGKSLLKKIPGVGLLMGLAFAGSRLMEGDLGGAGLEALSGLAATIPGIGTAASVALDGALMAKDAGAFDSELAAKETEAAKENVAIAEEKYKFVPPPKVEYDDNPSGLFLDGELPKGVTAADDTSGLTEATPEQKDEEANKVQETQLEVLEEVLNTLQMSSGSDVIRVANNSIGSEKLNSVIEALDEIVAVNKPMMDQIPESGRVNDILDAGKVAINQFASLFGGNPFGGGDAPTKIPDDTTPTKMPETARRTTKTTGNAGQTSGLYAKAINDPNYEVGSLTRISESGRLDGAGTISTGKGDFGGKSYGSNQLSSKTGTLQTYLDQSEFGSQFKGLQPGSKEFDSKWTQLAAQNKGFGKDQNAFIDKTHFTPFKEKAEASGLNLSGRSNGVQEILHSTSNQFGANSSILKKFSKDQGGVESVNSMSDAELIEKFSQYKSDNVGKYFKSSSGGVQAGVKKRFERERVAALGLDEIQAGANPMGFDGAGVNTASNEMKREQVASLEAKTDQLNKTMSDKKQAPIVVADSGGNQGGNIKETRKGSGAISGMGFTARNFDTTISRLSERFISDSLS